MIPKTGKRRGGREDLQEFLVRAIRQEGAHTDAKLCEAIENAEKGLIDADYGDGLIKQRIARPGEGKSGGYRSIILFRKGERSFFVYGFATSDRDTIDKSDERDFKELAAVLLKASDEQVADLIASGKYQEVHCDGQDQGLQERH